MSQKAERQKAIEKVRKLRDRAHGAGSSENEVEFAMKTMGELMDTFDISMDEVSLAAQECKKITIEFADGNVFRLGTVTVAVANFCDCVTYYSPKRKVQKTDREGKRVFDKRTGRPHFEKAAFENHFFGIDSDAEMAAYLMEMIREASKSMLADFKKTDVYKAYTGNKTILTKSFVDGFASRIVGRLNELKRQRDAELEAARQAREEMGEGNLDAERAAAERRAGRSTDIVLLKDKKVKDEFKAQMGWAVKYKTSSRSGGGCWTGRSAGGSAANNVNLSRPVGGGGYSGQRQLAHG